MKKPTIIAKSALDIKQLKHKVELGCDGIELQLYDELINTDGFSIPWGAVVNVERLSQFPITSIHMPISKRNPVLLENIGMSKASSIFVNVVSLANTIGYKRNSKVLVVVHTELSRDTWVRTGLLDDVASRLVTLLNKYPYVTIGIENLPSFMSGKDNSIIHRDVTPMTAHDIAKAFRYVMRTDRIGSVFDTCHAIGSARMHAAVCNALQVGANSVILPDTLMREYASTCMEIHLGNARQFGLDKTEHGTVFETPEETVQLNEFMNIYQTGKWKCPICIEIQENDYLNCVNYSMTREQLNFIFGPQKQTATSNDDDVLLHP